MKRRDFLKLAGVLPVIGKIAKDLMQDAEVIEIDELELELAAWDDTSDDAWRYWLDRYEEQPAMTTNVGQTDDWWIATDNRTYPVGNSSSSIG